jgi:hypothetical protein
MADVKDIHRSIALIYRVDDSIGALFLARKQMAKFLTFGNYGPALRISPLQ